MITAMLKMCSYFFKSCWMFTDFFLHLPLLFYITVHSITCDHLYVTVTVN